MIAINIREPGDPDVLVPVERPRPTPASGELLIKVAAAGVNRPDVMQRRGRYPPPPGASDIPGLEVAGTIDAVGDGVYGLHVGDAVCALVAGGGYAEYCAAPAPQCLPVPRNLDVLAMEGRLVQIATQGGMTTQLNLMTVMQRRLTITGSTLRVRPVAEKGAIAAAVHDRVWPLIESGAVKPVIHATFPLREA